MHSEGTQIHLLDRVDGLVDSVLLCVCFFFCWPLRLQFSRIDFRFLFLSSNFFQLVFVCSCLIWKLIQCALSSAPCDPMRKSPSTI